ncbi:MAG: phospho-N-acetylmuramoyl-pentapeptide-transferase [Anaerolineae bacterium]|nr:phospho-N-acetylmuramoyl-pentapeptide-transferase [Anaerolineae bacterium]RIK24102.1 MAG: phospho-N-acetylmuramoyl-pentapeptide-transferase [Anaerolineae bacterium]
MGWAMTVAAATFLLSVIWGGPLIEIMRRLRLGKNIRIDGPATHAAKMGTPAMGGILIVGWTLVVSLMVSIVQIVQALETAESVVIPLGVMVAYSILGGIDDYQGFRLRPGEGMRARMKLMIQLTISLVAAVLLYWLVNDRHGWIAVPTVPFLVDIGLLYIPAAIILITGSANAVNLTDGLDGLAGLISATAFVAYGVIAFLQDQQFLVVFSFIVIGATFGFLWYNAKPAQMFMGDVGSQALGASLGVLALMTNQWLIFPIVITIPVATELSSTLQVLYFRATGGKRLFKMAPLHHHFELIGWSETQIVQRWWLIAMLTAMIGIALALV